MLTFDCGHSALCRVLYVKLLNSSTMFFKSKKLFFLTLKKMFFFKYYRRYNSASIYEWDKKERENWVSGF